MLGSHLFFQSEKSYNGGHYVNLMNSKYDRVGIGVWVSSGRVRLVVDFYHPRGPRATSARGRSGHDAAVIRNVVVHLLNEQPLLTDLYELPEARRPRPALHEPADDGRQAPGLHRPNRVDLLLPVSPHPLHRDPACDASGLHCLEAPVDAEAGAGRAEAEADEDLEIDEDFLRRIREV